MRALAQCFIDMKENQIKAKDNTFLAKTYNRYDIVLQRGKGSILANDTKTYIDFGGGIAVNTLGNADNKWAKAVYKQLKTLSHTSNLYYTEPCVELAEALCIRTGYERVFFSNSGAEANECAIKCARKYSLDKYGASRYEIITLKDSFHGRTLATLSATGQDEFHQHFFPFLEGFVYADANTKSITDNINPKTAAILIETIQGEGGVNVLDKGFVSDLYEICQQRDILLIVDEVQSGNGRTGKLYSYMDYNIMPDIVTTAKGLGGGLPIGATLLGKKTADVLTGGTHGSTFGGNPAIAKGALHILNRLTQKMLAEVREKGEFIQREISTFSKVKKICGKGLMIGVEIDCDAKEVVNKCHEKGLLILTAKHKLRILPPLNISYKQITKGLKILKEVLQ